MCRLRRPVVFFFNDTATTEIYTSIDTLSLHDALPIFYSCLLNCMPGIGCGLYSCEMCAPIWLEALEPIPKNGFVFSWKKCETSREAAGLNDCEFPGSGGWHTLALRNRSTLNTSIYRRTRDEGWLRR